MAKEKERKFNITQKVTVKNIPTGMGKFNFKTSKKKTQTKSKEKETV